MQLILATALPSVVAEIGGSDQYGLVFSSYLLASLASIPLFSKLADIYGKRRFYLAGMGIFGIGSWYGGLSSNMTQLIVARVVQGIGAGIIAPVALAMIADMFPAEKRGSMIGMFGLVQLLANLLSPPLGRFITTSLGWPWIFYLNLGLVILSSLLVVVGDRHPESRLSMKPSEVDILGGLLFGGFCVLTVAFANFLGKNGTREWTWLWFLAGIVLTASVLVIIEIRHRNPVIKMEFFKIKPIRTSLLSAILAGAIMYGLVTILPLCGLVLRRQGFQFDESKILLLFMLGIAVGVLVSSRLSGKLRSAYLPRLLWGLMSFSAILLVYSISIRNLILFNSLNVLVGLCTGGIMATFLINSQNAVRTEDRTTLSGLIQLGRYFGASLGITILAGAIPDVTRISGLGEFVGAFGFLVALCAAGLVNEMI